MWSCRDRARFGPALAFLAGAVLFPAKAWSVPYELLFENDPAVLDNKFYSLGYASLADFINANTAHSDLTAHNFQTGGDVAGFTYDGSQYHLIFENRPNIAPGIGNEVFLLSYDSIADIINANAASSVETLNNFQTGGDIAGFTFDGSQYHVVFENRPNIAPGIGNEVFLLSYDTLADFVNANEADSVETLNSFQTGGDIVGFAYDGIQFQLAFENRPNIAPGIGNEVFVLSYDTLADFVSANAASSIETLNSFQTGGDIAGFEAINDFSQQVPAPATLTLFGVGLAGLGCSRRKRSIGGREGPFL